MRDLLTNHKLNLKLTKTYGQIVYLVASDVKDGKLDPKSEHNEYTGGGLNVGSSKCGFIEGCSVYHGRTK